ncbi:MAG: helix-turn-helix transcriptional regulator [Acidobacteria bacterium]|nr:helix-turn-helix transcriptional regulator [Acidobacteriota bacterium]
MIAQHLEIRQELDTFVGEVSSVPAELPHQVAKLLQYVHAHLFEPNLSVKVVKTHCNFHDNNVTLRFGAAMGTSLREYIESLRLTAADRLLRKHPYPIYIIAMAVGYTYPETFCRAYQRQFGCQPSAHRAEARQDKKSR